MSEKLDWDNAGDRLEIIKQSLLKYVETYNADTYVDYDTFLNLAYDDYIPWMIERIEELENQPKCPLHGYFLVSL